MKVGVFGWGLLAFGLLAGCGEDVTAPREREFRQLFTTLYSNLRIKANLVVSDNPGWTQLWAVISAGTTDARTLPTVDFDSEEIVIAALGEQRKAGYAVRIEQVEYTDTTRNVVVLQTAPGPACSSAEVITTPLDAAVISKSNAPIRFIERLQTINC